MEVQLRDPNELMKLSRLGSFHQSKLSFLRSFLKEFKDWKFNKSLFDLDEYGHGIAVYSLSKKKRTTESLFSGICRSKGAPHPPLATTPTTKQEAFSSTTAV